MKYLLYSKYLLRHKWFVFVVSCRLGIPWLGLTHDFSKFFHSECKPYAQYFYGVQTESVCSRFKVAWNLHQIRNKHHWQWWCLITDDGKIDILPMGDRYRREMLADWIGAGRAKGNGLDILGWYGMNKEKILLAPETKA